MPMAVYRFKVQPPAGIPYEKKVGYAAQPVTFSLNSQIILGINLPPLDAEYTATPPAIIMGQQRTINID